MCRPCIAGRPAMIPVVSLATQNAACPTSMSWELASHMGDMVCPPPCHSLQLALNVLSTSLALMPHISWRPYLCLSARHMVLISSLPPHVHTQTSVTMNAMHDARHSAQKSHKHLTPRPLAPLQLSYPGIGELVVCQQLTLPVVTR